jgi:hypothetical protein
MSAPFSGAKGMAKAMLGVFKNIQSIWLVGLDIISSWLLGWSWNLDRLQVSPFSERLVCLALAASKGINLYKLQKAVERFAAEIVWSAGCIFPSRGRTIRLSQASFELC